MTREEARSFFWTQGIVAPWYLRRSQLDIYELLLRERFAFVEAARRFGKTNSILAFVIERLRLHPGWIARWCFPFKNQARDVLLTEVAKLQIDCPEDLRFHYHNTDSVFIGPKGSKLYIRGVNEDRGESARGPASNIIIADEYGFWNEPQYIIKEVLFPQLENQEGRWLIKASTPPRNLGHPYYDEKEEAIRKNRFVQKIIYDNEALSPQELQEIIDECGGVNSPSFRRERLCEPVSDPGLLVIPEWSDEENTVPNDYPRPEYFAGYVGGDSGADDNTAILFGYYNFLKDEFVIEDEIVINGKTTGEITSLAKEKERELWDDQKPRRRVYDSDKQTIFDLFGDYKYPMEMAEKSEKRAAIHDLRVEIGSRRFKVKERCKHLRRQMKVGMWRDEKKLDFERTEGLGHLDAIAAALYLNRSIERSHNPIPQHHGFRRDQQLRNPDFISSNRTAEDALASIFNRK